MVSDERKTDHLGITYPTISAMCAAWGIRPAVYEARLSYGWSKENALTCARGTRKTGEVTDHLGNVYATKKAMCDAYGITPSVYYGRLSMGYTQEQALTLPLHITFADIYNEDRRTDHLGRVYDTHLAMCEAYGITPSVYYDRKVRGMTKEEILTTPYKPWNKSIDARTDHLGNTYPSMTAMCEHYGISRTTYIERRRRGWKVGKALTTKAGNTTSRKGCDA